MDHDAVVRVKVREHLPPEVFARRPLRSLLIVPMVALDVALCVLIVQLGWAWWYLLLPISLFLGSLRAGMMFFGHEVTHGATVRSRPLQDLCLYPGCAMFGFSPYVWRVWHNRSHHAHTNEPDKDPDNFGTLEGFLAGSPLKKLFTKFAPGSGHLPSFLYVFLFFAVQAQNVIWSRSREMPGYESFNRQRAAFESLSLLAFWIAIGVWTGPVGMLFIIVVPFLTGNVIILSYVLTNHMLCPLREAKDSLDTSLSVTTLGILDRLHFHFSHHIEHHLFPALCSSQTPHVRRALQELYPDRYMAPAHWKAILMIFRTPRVYDGNDVLIEPFSGRREDIGEVGEALRTGKARLEPRQPVEARSLW